MVRYVLTLKEDEEQQLRELAGLCDEDLDGYFLVKLLKVGVTTLARSGQGLTPVAMRRDGKVLDLVDPWLDRMARRIQGKGVDAIPALAHILER